MSLTQEELEKRVKDLEIVVSDLLKVIEDLKPKIAGYTPSAGSIIQCYNCGQWYQGTHYCPGSTGLYNIKLTGNTDIGASVNAAYQQASIGHDGI